MQIILEFRKIYKFDNDRWHLITDFEWLLKVKLIQNGEITDFFQCTSVVVKYILSKRKTRFDQ